MYQCVGRPETLMTVDAFAEVIDGGNSELFNGKRLPIGISELAGCILNFDQIATDGVDREILHPNLLVKWKLLFDQHDLKNASQQLNTNDYPKEIRNVGSITIAVENLLHFATAISNDWQYWSEVFLRSTCQFVDVSLRRIPVDHKNGK